MNDVFNSIIEKFKRDKSTNIALLLGLAGIVVIGISGLIDDKDHNINNEEVSQNIISADVADEYCKTKTAELEAMLESIDGVTEAKVMLNVTCSEEYVYARTEQNSSTNDESGFSSEISYDYYSSEVGGDNVPILIKVINPQISSCAASCKGAENANVRENIYLAISAALGLDINKIYVAPLG